MRHVLFIIFPVPLCELPQTVPETDAGFKTVIFLQRCAVREGDRHISRLHADQFLMTRKVIIRGQYVGPDQFLL